MKTEVTGFKDKGHDHKACIEHALAQAEKVCDENGARLTDLRRQVLNLVWSSHKPVKAYDLLAELAAVRTRATPATVYRALDFMQELGLVHKLESLNAYLGCSRPDGPHPCQFLICEVCGQVAEIGDASVSRKLRSCARQADFEISDETVEMKGTCARCSQGT